MDHTNEQAQGTVVATDQGDGAVTAENSRSQLQERCRFEDLAVGDRFRIPRQMGGYIGKYFFKTGERTYGVQQNLPLYVWDLALEVERAPVTPKILHAMITSPIYLHLKAKAALEAEAANILLERAHQLN